MSARTYTAEQIGAAIKRYEEAAKTDKIITPWAILTDLEGGRIDQPVDRRLRVNLPLVPMSYNAQRYTHWRKVRRMNRPLVESLTLMLRNRGIPQPCAFIRAEAELTFPTLRRRDEGNFRTPLEKALGDVLVKEGFLTDDTPEQFRMGQVSFAPHKGPGATRLTLLLTHLQED